MCSRQPLALDPLAGWTRGSMSQRLLVAPSTPFPSTTLLLTCLAIHVPLLYYHRPNDAVTVAVLASMAVLLFGADALLSK